MRPRRASRTMRSSPEARKMPNPPVTSKAWSTTRQEPSTARYLAARTRSIAVLWLAFFGYMSYLISRQDHQRGWTADFSDDPFMSDRASTDLPMEPVRFESGAGSVRVEK